MTQFVIQQEGLYHTTFCNKNLGLSCIAERMCGSILSYVCEQNLFDAVFK